MIVAGGRWLSLILVCLVVGCHQAPPASRPPADPASPDQRTDPTLIAATGPIITAFSLRAAERILTESEPSSADISTLAGITRPLGLVYDPGAEDLIIVGQVGDGDPVILDDLVVMMRSVLESGTWPLCSIDQTPETPDTGMQTVRFEGIENTRLGADCFLADTTLKTLALGQLTAESVDIPSYFDMLLSDIEDDGQWASMSSRLWGYPMQPSLIRRGNTFAIRDMKIGVQAEALRDPTSPVEPLRDEIAEEFAKQLTESYDQLSSEFPELERMAVMFRLAALAHGMRSLDDSPDLRYWLNAYDVPEVPTETEYPALRRTEMLDLDDETLTVQVEGGIGMDGGALRLEDGDLSVLREAVLRSRPDRGALTWRIPLRNAWFVSDAAPDGAEAPSVESRRNAAVDAGTYLTRRVEIVSRPAPGRPASAWGNAQLNGEWWPIPNQQPSARVEHAPFQQPPAGQPRVQQPPVRQPRVQQPPAYRPPVQQPPIQQPRVQQAPAQQPPVQQPRVQEPSVRQPQAQPAQVQQPKVQQPQAQQPQAQQPQAQQPQVRSAPAQQPAAQQPRAHQSQESQDERPKQSASQQSGAKESRGSHGRDR
jgi:hypothetical protein